MKKTIQLTENELNKLIRKSVNKIINESSYNSNGDFNPISHEIDLIDGVRSKVENIDKLINQTINSLNLEATSGVENSKALTYARMVINTLINTSRDLQKVLQIDFK